MVYKEPNTNERRRLKRQNLAFYMQVLDPDTLQVVGHLADINKIGLMVDGLKPLIIGREYRLRLDTTPEVADKTSIQFHAKAKWCRMDKITPNTYNIGLEITHLSAHDADIIQRIADIYGKK